MTRPLFIKPTPASTPLPQQPPKLTGTVTLDGKRLAIRCAYTPSALGFFNSLPNSRFAKVAKQWTCQASPLAAYQLAETGLILDGGAAELAMAWVDHLSPIVPGSVDVSRLLKPPRPAQMRSMEFCSKKRGSILEHQMGLGKTFCAIGMIVHWNCRNVLVLCPKAVLGVWRREMTQYCGVSHNVTALEDGSNEAKDKQLAQAMMNSQNYAINMIVCNYESSWRGALSKRLGSIKWDALICDESHRASNAQSQQSKMAFELATNSKYKLLLTGTPMETPLDFFGQAKIIEPALFGTSFSRFRTRYAITHEQYKNKVLQLINMDEFNEKHKLVALRYETKDVWDLPELTHSTIPVTLSPSTMKLYRKLVKDSLVEMERGEISASNAGVKLIKLAQMACGHVKDDEGRVTRFSDEKKQVLLDFLRDLPKTEKVVVFCRFTEDLKQVKEVADELGRAYGEVSGQRRDMTEHAQFPPHINVMGVQERAGGLGVDLTAARYGVWFSHGYSSRDCDQANARIHRPGQKMPTFIYHLVSTGTVDTAIVNALERKMDLIAEVLSHVKACK